MTITLENLHFNRGIDLFNQAHFFEAHEILEDVWRPLTQDRILRRRLRLHVQGMVQLAVSFHHVSTGNFIGARSVLERALRNLNGANTSFPDLDLGRLRTELALWKRFLDDVPLNTPHDINKKKSDDDIPACKLPPFPKIIRR